jgi:hypothetical protein
MSRSTVTTAAALLLAGSVAAASGAAAAPAKHKTKVLKGSFQVQAPPDPTMDATAQVGMECHNIDPLSVVEHALTMPAKGTLKVDLNSPDPTGGHMDWDLYLLNGSGTVIGSSHGPTASEEVVTPIGKGKVTVRACNLAGEPSATVTWALTYKK